MNTFFFFFLSRHFTFFFFFCESKAPLLKKFMAPIKRLKYVQPWPIFWFVALWLLYANYLGFFAVYRSTSEKYWEAVPAYVTSLEQSSAEAWEQFNHQKDLPVLELVRLVAAVVGYTSLYYLSYALEIVIPLYSSIAFKRKRWITYLCLFCWVAHAFEVYETWTICRNGKATRWTTIRLMIASALGGVAQLTPLKEAAAAQGFYHGRSNRKGGKKY